MRFHQTIKDSVINTGISPRSRIICLRGAACRSCDFGPVFPPCTIVSHSSCGVTAGSNCSHSIEEQAGFCWWQLWKREQPVSVYFRHADYMEVICRRLDCVVLHTLWSESNTFFKIQKTKLTMDSKINESIHHTSCQTSLLMRYENLPWVHVSICQWCVEGNSVRWVETLLFSQYFRSISG